MDLRKRLYFLLPAALVAVLHNAVHETVHYLTARLLGKEVLEFRLFSNGWGTSQVVYATPATQRTGPHWLLVAWVPAVLTVLIGYLLYTNRARWISPWPPLNAALWYGGLFFLCLDPFYYAILSLFLGSDVDAVAAVGWSPWPVRGVALAILVLNAWLMWGWWRESRAHPGLYVPAGLSATAQMTPSGTAQPRSGGGDGAR